MMAVPQCQTRFRVSHMRGHTREIVAGIALDWHTKTIFAIIRRDMPNGIDEVRRFRQTLPAHVDDFAACLPS